MTSRSRGVRPARSEASGGTGRWGQVYAGPAGEGGDLGAQRRSGQPPCGLVCVPEHAGRVPPSATGEQGGGLLEPGVAGKVRVGQVAGCGVLPEAARRSP
jgi:hypothetical protein